DHQEGGRCASGQSAFGRLEVAIGDVVVEDQRRRKGAAGDEGRVLSDVASAVDDVERRTAAAAGQAVRDLQVATRAVVVADRGQARAEYRNRAELTDDAAGIDRRARAAPASRVVAMQDAQIPIG